jgi:hypothetical protein
MYGFGEELTKENLLSRISSYDIYKYYSENFTEVGKHFSSDFRNDSNPSCCIAQIKGDLLYTDFGTGESYRCIDFVMAKLGLNFVSALEQINSDFNLGLGNKLIVTPSKNTEPVISKITPKFKEKSHTIIKKKQRPFTSQDLEFWNSFYWTEEMLNLSKTQSISHYWINGTKFIVRPNELAFSYEYYWHGGRAQRKLYFPQRKEFKWFSNVDNTIVQLVDVAPKQGDILVITSSKKDAGIFWRMNLDRLVGDLIIHGVAPNTENSMVPPEWLKKAQNRYKKVILWYNNDWDKSNNPGVTNARKYSELHDLPYFYNPDNEPKDPSDFAKKHGLQEFVNYFKQQVL